MTDRVAARYHICLIILFSAGHLLIELINVIVSASNLSYIILRYVIYVGPYGNTLTCEEKFSVESILVERD